MNFPSIEFFLTVSVSYLGHWVSEAAHRLCLPLFLHTLLLRIWTPPSLSRSRPFFRPHPLDWPPPPEDVVADMTANSPQFWPKRSEGWDRDQSFFPFVKLSVYLTPVLAHFIFKARIGCSVLGPRLMICSFIPPSLLAFAGGISTQLPAPAKKIKEEKEKRREAKENVTEIFGF